MTRWSNQLIVAAVYIYMCSSVVYCEIDAFSYPPIPTFIWLSILDFVMQTVS